MSCYEKYKPTNIEWIAEIPEHWELKKLKYSTSINDEVLPETTDDSFEINYIEISSIQGGKIVSKQSILFSEAPSRARRKVKNGDIIVSTVRTYLKAIARIENPEDNMIVSTGFAVVRPREIKSDYLGNLFFSAHLLDEIISRSVGVSYPAINSSEIGDIKIPIPPPEEQIAIANYLDKKTAQIDKLIANKQNLIDLMLEEKKVLINESITGKNKNWKTVKFNHYVRLRHGYQFMNYDFTSTGIKVVKITQLSAEGYLDLSEATYIDAIRLTEFEDILINEGDILMALTGGTIGKIIRVGKVDEPLLQNYRVGNFFPASPKITKDFIFWLLSSEYISSQIFFEQRETGQPNIGKENFNSFKIYLPSIEEQNQVINFLNIETQRIDSALTNIKKEIELIEEYKSSLISEVVTGKQKVVN